MSQTLHHQNYSRAGGVLFLPIYCTVCKSRAKSRIPQNMFMTIPLDQKKRRLLWLVALVELPRYYLLMLLAEIGPCVPL